MFWHELWREPGLFVLFGLILIVIGELVPVTYRIVGRNVMVDRDDSSNGRSDS
jgi:hypothetical protein